MLTWEICFNWSKLKQILSMNSVKRNHKGRFPSHIPLYIAYLNTLIPNSDKVYLSNPINLNIKNNSPIREKTINGINNLLALLMIMTSSFLILWNIPDLKKNHGIKKKKTESNIYLSCINCAICPPIICMMSKPQIQSKCIFLWHSLFSTGVYATIESEYKLIIFIKPQSI